MSKWTRPITARSIERRLDEGRGQGIGKAYKPWLTVRDVPSRGQSARIKSWTIHREHHLLSLNEQRVFYYADWSDRVIDIREQYPLLPLEATLAIAEVLGVRHPYDRRTGHPIVMTTDFVVTVRAGYHTKDLARAVKPLSGDDSLQSERVLEKLQIEKAYWRARDVEWAVVPDVYIDRVFAENVRYLHKCRDLEFYGEIDDDAIRRIRAVIEPDILRGIDAMRFIAARCDDRLGFAPGSSLFCCRHLLATKAWGVDMRKPIDPNRPLVLVSSPSEMREVAR